MERLRFYCNPIEGSTVELIGSEAHHLSAVRRLAAGDKVELFDGAGTLASAIIKSTGHRKALLEIEDVKAYARRSSGEIIIAPSVAKGERFDWLIAKCTELGVDRITPLLFERTVKLPKNPKIVERWTNIAISSAKQCRRLFLPRIDGPIAFPQALEEFKREYPDAKFIFGSLKAGEASLFELSLTFQEEIIAFIGPEGGFNDEELGLLEANNCLPVRLTDTVLRTETAGLALAAILTAQRDNLRS
jgi:16S rRNA (uracil1498-N3)-methyltransferase